MDIHEDCRNKEKELDDPIGILMEEGYREMAEENRRLAEEFFPLVIEMLLRIDSEDD